MFSANHREHFQPDGHEGWDSACGNNPPYQWNDSNTNLDSPACSHRQAGTPPVQHGPTNNPDQTSNR